MNYKIYLPSWLKPIASNDLIRLGRKNDGGYLVQKSAILNQKKLISFGINDDWSFEKDFLNLNKGSKIYLFDRSVNFAQIFKLFIKNIFHLPNFSPLLYSIKAVFSYHYFFNRKDVFFFSYFVGRSVDNESLSFKECLKLTSNDNTPLVIKIDIEGSEYRILDEIIEHEHIIEILIIEFHDIDIHLDKIKKFCQSSKLLISHLHVNNYSKIDMNNFPKDIEITFQKSLNTTEFSFCNYPHELDMPSNRLSKDLLIEWF